MVDWGDGTTGTFNGSAPTIQHTYTTPGVYQVSIRGDFPRIYFNNTGDRNKILSVDQRGDIERVSMNAAFFGCENLQVEATDVPNLSKVTDMFAMFRETISLNSDLSAWDMSNVTDMAYMFAGATNFNKDLNAWDVSKVKMMRYMFY